MSTEGRICIATTQKGEPCKKFAMKNDVVCDRHYSYPQTEQILGKESPLTRNYSAVKMGERPSRIVDAFKCPHCGGLTEV